MEQTLKQIELAYQEYYYYILLLRIGAGVSMGLIPLILGIRRKKRNLGVWGFIVSIVGGTITPILLIIIVPIFVWLILRKSNTEETANTENSSDTLISGD
ncbi:MAG: hypothetical protein ABJA66_10380 [Actinomycetota bacterium]